MKRLTSRRWLFPLVLTGGIVLLFLLIVGSLSDARRNSLVMEQLYVIQEMEHNLGENALKLRYGLTHNYDGINAAFSRLRRAKNLLENGEAALPKRGVKALDDAFTAFALQLDRHESLIEQFKSDNAVLKNSLQQFVPAVDALLRKIPANEANHPLRDELNALVQVTLRYGLGGEGQSGETIAYHVDRVDQRVSSLPSAMRREAINVVAHVRIIEQYRTVVDRLTQSLVFPRIVADIERLDRAVTEDALHREQRAEIYRLALGSLAALLLLAVVVSLLRLMRNAREIEQSHRFLDRISDNIGEGVLATDKSGNMIFANREALRLIGWEREMLLGRNLHDTLHANADGSPHDAVSCAMRQCAVNGETCRSDDEYFVRSNGTVIPVALVNVPLREEGEIGAVTVFRDMSEAREREKELRLAATVFENSPYGIVVTDRDAHILDVNPAFCTITGYAEGEVIGQNPRLLQSGMQGTGFYSKMWQSLEKNGYWKGELRNRRKSGEIYPEWMHIRAVRDGKGTVSHYVGIFSDITEYEQAARQLDYLSNYDTLTGLPNRVLFQDRLMRAIDQSQRQDSLLALLFLDLDHFKSINDSLGHAIGDKLLKAVAQRLQAHVGALDTLSRHSGDQFAVLLDGIASVAEIASKSRDLLESLAPPFHIDGHEIFTSACVGVAICPLDGSDAETLLISADTAMFRAKEAGQNSLQFFSADMTERVQEAMRMGNALRHAVKNGELTLHYQPQLDLGSYRIVGVEALLRWNSPELGAVSPARFIPLAEKTGLIVPIGAWVLNAACKQNKAWQDAGLPPMRVAVNLSALQFHKGDLIETVRNALAESGLEARYLELEITEGTLMDDIEETIAILNVLRKMGCEVAIDDFGTGYSSLSYLKRFPVDTLKIDQSFVRGLGSDADDSAVGDAVIGLGTSLGLKLVAEGVEDQVQLSALAARTERIAVQGYYFYRPMPAGEIPVCVMASQPDSAR